jgi:hypothetical protein
MEKLVLIYPLSPIFVLQVLDPKMVYISSLPLMPAVILSFLSSQVASLMQSYKNHELYFTGMIPVVLWYMNARSYVDLELPLPPLNFLPSFLSLTFPKNIRIYIETAIVVVISYMSLLIVNWSYIWLVVFPIIAIGFIAALCSELSRQSGCGSQRRSDDGEAGAGRKLAEGMEAAALVPYWLLCVMGQFHADKFAVSQFLLFFSFMLGALTMMMSRLALTIAADRGVAPASELLRKASLVVLLVAVHAVAAELLGENVVLFCLPEIAPVLLWFSVRLDGDDGAGVITAAEIKLESRVLAVLGAASASAMPILANYMDESVLYWCAKALVSCGVSGLLVYYLVFLLCQWPGQDGTATPFGKEAVRLLIFWANALLTVVSTLLFTSLLVAARLVLQEPMVAESGSQIIRRICQKFLEFIV